MTEGYWPCACMRGRRSHLRHLAQAVAALLLSGMLADASAQEPSATVEVLAGAGASMSDDSAIVPVALVVVDAPVFLGREPIARLRALLRLHGSPGATLDPRDVRTFQGAELDVALERRIGAGAHSGSYAVLGGGFATRRAARAEGARSAAVLEPADRFPLWYYGGLAVEHRMGDQAPSRRLLLGIGASHVSHPESLIPRDLVVQGHITLATWSRAAFGLHGDVARPLWGRGRGVFRIAVVVGWGR